MLLEQGWLVDTCHVLSPHYDCRPDDETFALLVAHNISLPPDELSGSWINASFTGIIDPQAHLFLAETAHLRVPAHCLIRRDGGIVQYAPFDKRAWHTGVSQYRGHEHYNDFPIGIELEGTDTLTYVDAQYQQPAMVTRALTGYYPDIAKSIMGHCDIAPDRKTDPGPAFDWVWFRVLANKETA